MNTIKIIVIIIVVLIIISITTTTIILINNEMKSKMGVSISTPLISSIPTSIPSVSSVPTSIPSVSSIPPVSSVPTSIPSVPSIQTVLDFITTTFNFSTVVKNRLNQGEQLTNYSGIISTDNQFALVIENNMLILYTDILRSTLDNVKKYILINTNNSSTSSILAMQQDGNLCFYQPVGTTPIWCSLTYTTGCIGSYLSITGDGDYLSILDSSNNKVWTLNILSNISNMNFGTKICVNPSVKYLNSNIALFGSSPYLYGGFTIQNGQGIKSSSGNNILFISNDTTSTDYPFGSLNLWLNLNGAEENIQKYQIFLGNSGFQSFFGFQNYYLGFYSSDNRIVWEKPLMITNLNDVVLQITDDINILNLYQISTNTTLWSLYNVFTKQQQIQPIFGVLYSVYNQLISSINFSKGNTLQMGNQLDSNNGIISVFKNCALVVTNGKLLLYTNLTQGQSINPLIDTGNYNTSSSLKFQTDGNVCFYQPSSNTSPVWCSYTNGCFGNELIIQDFSPYSKTSNFSLIIQDANGKAKWKYDSLSGDINSGVKLC